MATRVATITVGRDTFDVAAGTDLADVAHHVFACLGVDTEGDRSVATTPEATDALVEQAIAASPDVLVVVQATFTDASAVIELAERADTPILVWSFPESRTGENLRLNSLCGANLAAYSLRRRGHRCGFLHLDPAHPDAPHRVLQALDELILGPATPVRVSPSPADTTADGTTTTGPTTAVAEEVERAVRSSRVGVIGDPPVGFEPCVGDDDDIAARFGVIVDRLTLDDLFDVASAAPRDDVDAVTARIESTMSLPDGLDAADVEPSARLYCAMRHHADERGFGAFATRCWPECMVDFGGAACTPQALMGDDGVSGTCEADVLGAITSLTLRAVAGTSPFVADLVDIDEADGTSVLWHCGVAPPEMAHPEQPIEGAVHPNRKIPLVNQFVMRPGRVTVARVSQNGGGFSLVVGGGEMLDRPRPYSGTCGVIRWDEPIADVAATVFGRGLEHHLGVVYGDHQDVLVDLAARWGVPIVRLGIDR